MRSRTFSRSKGFSLIEMLVAMIFISILMMGMFQVYGAAMNSFSSTAEAMGANRIKRWAITQIEDDLQSAGYFFYHPGRELPGYISVDTATGQNALMIFPDRSATYNTLDPGTNTVVSETVWFDEVQFIEDQPLQVRAQLSAIPAANNLLTLTVTSGALTEVLAGDYVLLLDATYEICRVLSTTATTVTLDTSASAIRDPVDGNATGASQGLQYLSHQIGTDVFFVRPLQVVRYTVLPLALDPASATSMIPCLVRDQTAYPTNGTRFVWPAANATAAGVTRTIIAENVAGQPVTAAAPNLPNQYALRVDISPNNGTTWSRTGPTAITAAGGWPGIVGNFNTWVGVNGRAPYTSITDSMNPIWFRNIPALFKVDLTTRTALKRADRNNPTQRTYTYRSQTLVCQPRNFALGQ
ncbi:MAG: prepilin-type N-terminal cleavage/methylation domain-containing protein [Holophaga sp.]|nr:prepilin-type N-terminal cleavage/methylation domain-containing protein [Holophaga sp.]